MSVGLLGLPRQNPTGWAAGTTQCISAVWRLGTPAQGQVSPMCLASGGRPGQGERWEGEWPLVSLLMRAYPIRFRAPPMTSSHRNHQLRPHVPVQSPRGEGFTSEGGHRVAHSTAETDGRQLVARSDMYLPARHPGVPESKTATPAGRGPSEARGGVGLPALPAFGLPVSRGSWLLPGVAPGSALPPPSCEDLMMTLSPLG